MDGVDSIDRWYIIPDPWKYKDTPDDLRRREIILASLPEDRYKRALDVGAGEGWITGELPADEIHGLEISNTAAARFPSNVTRVLAPVDKYDLVIATGVLYNHYDNTQMIDWILQAASKHILLSNIKEWEVDLSRFGTPIKTIEFPYREFTQHLTIYDVTNLPLP